MFTQIPRTNERLVPSGPYIQFLGFDSQKGLWKGSVMIVLPPNQKTDLTSEPVLTYHDNGVSRSPLRAPSSLVPQDLTTLAYLDFSRV